MLVISAFMIYSGFETMSNGALLSRVINAQLNRLNEVTDFDIIDRDGIQIQPNSYGIEINNISFAYDDRKIIDDVSLCIPEKCKCAIVGPSGSGKTTLCRLIARFWDVDSGSIAIGGHDIREYTCDSLLNNFSIVFQNVYLFNNTIGENIRFGKIDASDLEVIEAAKKACCHDFIAVLPDGYDTMVGEGGHTLSGGERQRISIARAILKDAPIVILDEATASIDAENEAKLLYALDKLTENKTIITIAHRLKTVHDADMIIVLNKGRVLEKGDHETLMGNRGMYYNFIIMRETATSWSI
jgi:ATP-binding cassette subfamily B protein